MLQFIFPTEFTEIERVEALRWLEDIRAVRLNWATLIPAFNHLRKAIVVIPGQGPRTFASLYIRLIDRNLTDSFISALYRLNNVQQESVPLWAAWARQIQPLLEAAGLYGSNDSSARLLLAYCLYWWQATAKGYAFEVEVLRDLRASNLSFTAHDPRLRSERFTPYDLIISGFKGDIKTSTYFLRLSEGALNNEFYITRLWLPKGRSRTLVVFLKTLMWDQIDGETLLVAWHQLESQLPQPVRIVEPSGEFVVSDYEIWKDKMRQYQAQQEASDGHSKND